jgi:hypothetical protein
LSGAAVLKEARVEFQLEAEEVDTRAMQVLRNLCMRAFAQDSLLSIEIRPVPNSRFEPVVMLDLPSDENEDAVYPPVPDHIGFPIAWEGVEYSRLRRCVVECHRDLIKSEIEDLAARVDSWYEALERGGFALPVGFPEELDCVRGSVAQFESDSVEISVDVMLASENAWNPLMNIVDGWRRSGIPVLRVMVE